MHGYACMKFSLESSERGKFKFEAELGESFDIESVLDQISTGLINATLKHERTVTRAARRLGLKRTTLLARIAKYPKKYSWNKKNRRFSTEMLLRIEQELFRMKNSGARNVMENE